MELSKNGIIEDLKRWFDAYSDYIDGPSYSVNTIALYKRVISSFIEYSREYQDEIDIKGIKASYISNFISYLDERALESKNKLINNHTLSKSSKQAYLKAIKSFFVSISDNNDELITYERYFKNLKIADSAKPQEKIVYLSEDEIERLLTLLEKDIYKKDTSISYRNSLLIKLMLLGGLRISEALCVKLESFTHNSSKDMYTVAIYGKGGKWQSAYIAKKSIEKELEYFKEVVKEKGLLIRTRNGKPLDRVGAYRIVKTIYKRANIKKEGLHLLRHTLAMRLTKRGVNPLIIQKILRHSNINTTTIYAKADEEDVWRVMGLSPLPS